MTIAPFVAQWIALPLVGLGLLAGLVRMVRGPTPFDRVAALDFLGSAAVGFLAATAVATNSPSLVDAALPLALLAFLATLAFAHYLENRR
jgi:multicomponent Na+:H+ antiporter subunit F